MKDEMKERIAVRSAAFNRYKEAYGVIGNFPTNRHDYMAGFDEGVEYQSTLAAREVAAAEGRIANLRKALEHYANLCDDCRHGTYNHRPECNSYTGFGHDVCECKAFVNIAVAALDADDGGE